MSSTAAHGCHGLRLNYLGNAMLIRSLLKYWAPVIAWILLILLASGDLMSAEHTSRFLTPFLLWLNPDISAGTLTEIHFSVRKAAHITEYAILALLVSRGVFREPNPNWARSTLFVVAWIGCVLVATCDEFRQSFVESRGASPWDVMIDSAGAIFGLLLYAGWQRRRRPEGPPHNRKSQV
ncbi:MAG TPA: VanZ family protein [Chthoniobacterales bacterium]|nr:VanZ family protein [Chthoniobacterales bacterium]